ncbi:phage major capsid protein [Stomatohabitans albus]|uniref:phage major capsid protein n=1 Tax=Stomatohabitans albus TaxID=3110766 RepID=UPI00300CB556
MSVKEMTDELNALVNRGAELDAKARAEKRSLSGEEMAEGERILGAIAELKGKIDQAKAGEDLMAQLQGLTPVTEASAVEDQTDTKGSVGERFVKNREFTAWHAELAGPDGVIPESRKHFQSPAFRIGGLKDLILAGSRAADGGLLVQPDRVAGVEPLFREPALVTGMVDRRSTTSDTIEFVVQNARTNNAKMVEEAASTGNGQDGTLTLTKGKKPISSFELEKKTAVVKTGATLIPVTRRALADAAQLRGLIDAELRGNLQELLEGQIVKGDGAGENFTGILNTSGVQSVNQAAIGAGVTDTAEKIIIGVRKARRLIRSVGHTAPTAVLINPADAEAVDLARLKNGEFLGNGPFQFTSLPLWGLPRVESEHVEEGTLLVGDFKQATLWDRENVTIYMTESHADWFQYNLIALLGEFRAAFGVRRPAAFAKITLNA